MSTLNYRLKLIFKTVIQISSRNKNQISPKQKYKTIEISCLKEIDEKRCSVIGTTDTELELIINKIEDLLQKPTQYPELEIKYYYQKTCPLIADP